MTKLKLYEAGSIIGEAENGHKLVRVISEGQGSSGYYSRELLQEFAEVFSDSLSFMDHPIDPNKPHLRSTKDVAGEIVGNTWYEEKDGIGAIYGYYSPNPAHADFLERYGKKLGLSVFIAGEGRKDKSGKIVVESFDGADPYKSVDVVVAAGRGGRFEEHLNNPDAASVQETRKETMEIEELAVKVEALATAVASLVEHKQTEAKAELTAEASAKIAESAVSNFAGAVKAIEDAKLFKAQSDALVEKAKSGADITADIEAAKALAESIRNENTQDPDAQKDNGTQVQGVIRESVSTEDTSIKGWS